MKRPADLLDECSRLCGLFHQAAQQSTVTLRNECNRVLAPLRIGGIEPFVIVLVVLWLAIFVVGPLVGSQLRRKRERRWPKYAVTVYPDEQAIAESDSQIAEPPEKNDNDDTQLPAARRTRSIPTMLGRVAFKNPHAEGKFGDWLTAQYYTRRLKRPYRKLKSKLPGEKGIDGVYRRYHFDRKRSRYLYSYELLIIENKINGSVLSPGQLSLAWVRLQCDKMMQTGERELLDTAAAILHALSEGTGHKAKRLLITHNLVSGKSTRHHVDELGSKRELLGEWDNSWAVRKSLEVKLRKGEVRVVD